MGGPTEARRSRARLPFASMDETMDTVVIGAGPAGLVAAYHLQRAGVPFVVLDASGRVGDSWRARYDGLRLFSLPRYASLPGWPIPVRGFPTRDEMADYLEAYAARFDIPVRAGVQVRRVGRAGAGFTVETGTDTYACAKVVVSTRAGTSRKTESDARGKTTSLAMDAMQRPVRGERSAGGHHDSTDGVSAS